MKYDAIIIGSGQAGNPLTLRLADLGWRVALAENPISAARASTPDALPPKSWFTARKLPTT